MQLEAQKQFDRKDHRDLIRDWNHLCQQAHDHGCQHLNATAAGSLINVHNNLSNIKTVETANPTTTAAGGNINVSHKLL
jgi:hypothetical protein